MDAEITVGRGQWFSDVIPVFNPNTIYNKWITGIGGTTTAINEGYTIIISPNVAGIVSKEGIENVVAVYGGIDSQRIAKRTQEIEEQGLRPVIISTPDSFWKVDDALGPDIYHRFKCVIDEIHCFQEAASYRDSLPEFIDIYFQRFGQKAVITATLSPLSHPLFEKWQTMRLVPQYEYRQPMKVYYSTNQLFASVTEFVESLPAEEKKSYSSTRSNCQRASNGLDWTSRHGAPRIQKPMLSIIGSSTDGSKERRLPRAPTFRRATSRRSRTLFSSWMHRMHLTRF